MREHAIRRRNHDCSERKQQQISFGKQLPKRHIRKQQFPYKHKQSEQNAECEQQMLQGLSDRRIPKQRKKQRRRLSDRPKRQQQQRAHRQRKALHPNCQPFPPGQRFIAIGLDHIGTVLRFSDVQHM